jgi:AraC-like DNA-binding protein
MYVSHETFEDADRHAYALSGWDQRYDQVGAGAFHSTVKQVSADGVQVFQESASVRVVQRGRLPPGRATFGLVLGSGAPLSFQGVKIDQSALIFSGGAGEFLLHSPPDMSLLGIAIDSGLLATIADAQGFDLPGDAHAQQVLAIPAAVGARMGRRIVGAVEAVLASPTEHAGPEAEHRFANAVAESLLELLTLHVPDREDRLTHACRSEIVKRSHELVLSQPEQPVSIMDLCATLRVSRRTIQNSFQSVTQMNPIAYLRGVRLAQVRRLLTTTSQRDVPVREAAMRWGFWNLGHFASDYRNL